MISGNAWGLCITAPAGTELGAPYSSGTVEMSSPTKAVYVPRDFILHAASLRQTFVHCGIFSAAASRRSRDRVSVPSVGVSLSAPLSVIALVRPLPYQLADTAQATPGAINLYPSALRPQGPSGIAPPFGGICPTPGDVPTCYYLVCRGSKPARLACLIHAASVHPELGSNS